MKVLSNQQFWLALMRSVIFSTLSVIISTSLGMAMALVLNRSFGANVGCARRSCCPWWATPVATSLVLDDDVQSDAGHPELSARLVGLPPSLWVADTNLVILCVVLVDVWHSSPIAMIVLLAGLRSLPREPVDIGDDRRRNAAADLPADHAADAEAVLVVVLIFRTIDFTEGLRHHLGHHGGRAGHQL